jgi:hypothetical protein
MKQINRKEQLTLFVRLSTAAADVFDPSVDDTFLRRVGVRQVASFLVFPAFICT